MVTCSLWRVFTCLLTYLPVSLPCPPKCASSIPLFSYFFLQRPQELRIILRIALYISTQFCWTTTELQIVRIGDTNQHREGTTLALYIRSNRVQFGPVLKYRLCL